MLLTEQVAARAHCDYTLVRGQPLDFQRLMITQLSSCKSLPHDVRGQTVRC